MRIPSFLKKYYGASLILFFGACKTIQPKAPVSETARTPDVPALTSQIIIPVKADLTSYFQKAEKSVPAETKGEDNPCEGLRYAFLFRRGPLSFSGKDKYLKLSLNGEYQVSGSYCAQCAFDKCLLKTPTFSCGVHEPMRNISIGFISEVGLNTKYQLQTKTGVDFVQPVDPCKISFANIDITGKLVSQIRISLQQLASQVDIQTATYPFRNQMQELWNKLCGEFPAGELGYFQIRPGSLSLSSIEFDGKNLMVQAGIRCQPQFSLRHEPLKPSPLPDMQPINGENGFTVYVDASLPYPEMKQMAKKMLPDTTFNISGKLFHIDEVGFMQAKENKLTTIIRFSGSKKGIIYLTGTPKIDTLKNELSIPDLDFDMDTRNVLMKTAGWILNSKIEKVLRKKMTLPLTTILQTTKQEAEKALNRKLDNGLELKGSMASLQLKSIYALPDKLLVRIMTKGVLAAEMK